MTPEMGRADPLLPCGALSELMSGLRRALRETDDSVNNASQYRHRRYPGGGTPAIDAVDSERHLYTKVNEVLRVVERVAVEPGQRLAFAFVHVIDQGVQPGSVSVDEISIRIELEHIQLITRDKEPRVYLDTHAPRRMHCPPHLSARLAELPDTYPGEGTHLVLVLIDSGGKTAGPGMPNSCDADMPAIAALW